MYRLFFIGFLFSVLSTDAQQHIDVTAYHFEIELTDLSDAITGKSRITVQFLESASQVTFDLASVKDDKGMYAYKVTEGGKALRTTHTDDVLTITLPEPAHAGTFKTFEIDYMGTPKDGLIISKNKYGDRTFFADNWPNRAHQWIPCHDSPDDKAAFEFVVTAPVQYQVISNGIKINETNISGRRKMTHWKEAIPLSTKVMVIGVAKFAVKELSTSPSDLPVSAWVYPQDSTKGFYDFGVAPEVVKFFTAYIGPFPFKKLANVQSKTIFGGMENAGAIFYAEESVTGDRKGEDVIVHEIVHQWFGDMASEKSFAHIWLSEGFATYLTDMYVEKKYGREIFLQRLQNEKDVLIEFVKKNSHPVVDSTRDLMSLLNANSYQKGAWVLHMLRNEVGDSTFQHIIQLYFERYAGGNAETRDFQRIAEKVTQRDLQFFFDQWLYRPGIPGLTIHIQSKETSSKIRIIQTGQLYQLTLELGMMMDNGLYAVEPIRLNKRETEFEFKGKGKVVIDPEKKLLFKEGL